MLPQVLLHVYNMLIHLVLELCACYSLRNTSKGAWDPYLQIKEDNKICLYHGQVLDALEEIAFRPEFLPTRIEKERKAVLAEAQVGILELMLWLFQPMLTCLFLPSPR